MLDETFAVAVAVVAAAVVVDDDGRASRMMTWRVFAEGPWGDLAAGFEEAS